MPADTPLLVAGGNLEALDRAGRSWVTNWPLLVVVVGTAALGLAISPGALSAVLAAAWVGVYLLAHWAVVMRGLPGAGPVAVILLSLLALLLLRVSDQGLHMFAAFMLVWVLLPTFRSGLVGTLALGAGLVLVLLPGAAVSGTTAVMVALATGAGSALFSIMMSALVWRSEQLSHERRELAEELAETVRTLEGTRTELLALERRRGAQEEATRLSAEIHDTLAQSFTSITMLAQAARQSAPGPSPLLDQIEELSRDGLAEARALIARSQQPLDLAASIDRLAADLAERTGLRVEADTAGWSPLSTRSEVVLLRTLPEALRNTERHADASTVGIRLAREDAGALLEVVDDGRGFDPSLPTAGFGLIGMRARLEAEGGTLEVDAAHGRGTALRAALPAGPGTPSAAGAPAVPAHAPPAPGTPRVPLDPPEVPRDR
jgi:signal transduction histidine kinase